jgi:precorrin-6A/cobalt-precorrin-6A reductase
VILILGGTAEARTLAARLDAAGESVVSSLAGRVRDPALPPGEVRIGGFGGVEGLARFLRERRVRACVDATHPFAALISEHAAQASAAVGCPLLRLERPSWRTHPDAETWTWVSDETEVLQLRAERPVLTTGRQTLHRFLPWTDRDVLARVVDPPDFTLPSRWRLVTSRGPYAYAGERALLSDHRADLLVTKDSGGEHTTAKLAAAADLGLPVAVIARPPPPSGVPVVATVAEAMAWLAARSTESAPRAV